MHITYLCSKHAEWVYGHPVEALHFLARDELQGDLLLQDTRYREAIPYLGCAFDIAVLLYDLEEGQNHSIASKILALAYKLSLAYQHVDAPQELAAILSRAVAVTRPGTRLQETELSPAFLMHLIKQGDAVNNESILAGQSYAET
ncbi:hypothetical protein CA267_007940 [Alteromonas pelagimontana]|uniref:Uncharacterized protein n=1 Tax=Alteromonas pelagimontana TaxID=1858656 RepID=A0A6M4MBY4_9ALTE|nr:hypothetical protein [Alteromonas pelagimontana]QJR80714.1 hypothetical protein CA267_007940 [Alteromonas pelagimontana]